MSSDANLSHPYSWAWRSVVLRLGIVEVVVDSLVTRVIGPGKLDFRARCSIASICDSYLGTANIELRLVGDMKGEVLATDEIIS
jgi:hypothetical protein